jgi:hypothetical protein
MVPVLTAAFFQVARDGGHEDDGLLLVLQELVHQLPEQVVLHLFVDGLQLTINVI